MSVFYQMQHEIAEVGGEIIMYEQELHRLSNRGFFSCGTSRYAAYGSYVSGFGQPLRRHAYSGIGLVYYIKKLNAT
jgi:hypothetical protein